MPFKLIIRLGKFGNFLSEQNQLSSHGISLVFQQGDGNLKKVAPKVPTITLERSGLPVPQIWQK